MKNIVLLLLAGLLLFSCSEDKIKTYDGTDFIYFAPTVRAYGANSTQNVWDTVSTFSFASNPVLDTLIRVAVKVGGIARDYDRYFKARIAGGTAVEGVHYDAFNDTDLVIKAGSIFGAIPIRFYYRDDLLDGEVDLKLELLPSDDFTLGFAYKYGRERTDFKDTIDVLRHTQILTALFPQPERWGDLTMGYYSIYKLMEFNRVNGLTLEDWESGRVLSSVTMMNVYRVQFEAHLRTYMTDPDTAIKDPKSDAQSKGYMTVPNLIELVKNWDNLLTNN
ncbi:MAG: DUF4843 domain-containing protein [Culturomica sp.]|nr:DUF4843 domain-containing protein [Culturomica sp.]